MSAGVDAVFVASVFTLGLVCGAIAATLFLAWWRQ